MHHLIPVACASYPCTALVSEQLRRVNSKSVLVFGTETDVTEVQTDSAFTAVAACGPLLSLMAPSPMPLIPLPPPPPLAWNQGCLLMRAHPMQSCPKRALTFLEGTFLGTYISPLPCITLVLQHNCCVKCASQHACINLLPVHELL